MQVIVDSLVTNYTYIQNPRNTKNAQNAQCSGGEKSTVLILHGWGDSSQSQGWLVMQRALAKNYNVCIVDLPGFGGSDMPATAWGLNEYAQFVAAFLAKIRLQPDTIIAHSNGGAIAIRGLASGKLHAGKLVLLASAGVRSEYKGRKRALRVVAKTGKALVMPLPSFVKDKLRRKLYTTVGSDMLVAEHLQETFKKIVDDDVQADAAELTLPTLLVYGQNDIATPVPWGMLLHERISGSILEIIGEAGHFVHQDQPDKVLRIIEDFIT